MEMKLYLICLSSVFNGRFIEGHEDLEDDPSSSQNVKVVAQVCELVARDHCMSLKLLED